jgi:hypothetical protein
MKTTDDMDFLHMGEVVLSFNGAPMIPELNVINHEPTLVLVFASTKNPHSIIKMFPKNADAFLDELVKTCKKLSIVDQRESFEHIFANASPDKIKQLNNHPFIAYIENMPDMKALPASIWQAKTEHYVEFIHVNAYSEFLKFDITFINKDVTRYTLPSSLAPLLIELLQNLKDLLVKISGSKDDRSS